jgi:hypothetical protein
MLQTQLWTFVWKLVLWHVKMASTKQVQQIKCNIGFDTFAAQCLTRKKYSDFIFYCTHTMMNVVFLLHNNFKEKSM